MMETLSNESDPMYDDTFSIYPSNMTNEELEDVVELERLSLYHRGKPCGAPALQKHLQDLGVTPVPSLYKIGKALKIRCLTYKRTGYYPGEYR